MERDMGHVTPGRDREAGLVDMLRVLRWNARRIAAVTAVAATIAIAAETTLAAVTVAEAIAAEAAVTAEAALVALAHDMVFTVGFYSLTGLEISPATMIGFLTVLGYSLYDTVVVFDKVRENTQEAFANKRSTFAAAANQRPLQRHFNDGNKPVHEFGQPVILHMRPQVGK